ncbi:MAG TPA: hypothetical protein VK188_19110 [Holophaga sp.]|nr:hypothetical protein [Holophaga sp.]
MTDAADKDPSLRRPEDEDTVSLLAILRENRFLAQMVVFFFLMLFVPLFLAWKFDLFLVAN